MSHVLTYHQVAMMPVLVVRDQHTGDGLQAWHAAQGEPTLNRDDQLIVDIDFGDDVLDMTPHEFHDFCANEKIAIPLLPYFSSSAAQQGLMMMGPPITSGLNDNLRQASGQDFKPATRSRRQSAKPSDLTP